MTEIDQRAIELHCKFIESADAYEAEVAPDLCGTELIAELRRVDYLPAPEAGERYAVFVLRTEQELSLSDTLSDAGVVDGDELMIHRSTHGAGPSVIDLAEVLAAAKIAIDAAQLVVDAYRAKTERISLELKRAELESQTRQGSADVPEEP